MTPIEVAELCAHHDAILKQLEFASTADELCELSIKAAAIHNEVTTVFEDMEAKRAALMDEASELLSKIVRKPHMQSTQYPLTRNLMRIYKESQE